MISEITLTPDQVKAKEQILNFIGKPNEHVFVLKGYAGTGKTTLIKEVLAHIPKAEKLAKLVSPNYRPKNVVLSATTHKAAEALAVASGMDVTTVHSHLGFVVRVDFSTGETFISRKSNAKTREDEIMFIDESSYIDEQLLGMILKYTQNCKLIFMGDPTQLTPVNSTTTPVFDKCFPEAELTQVIRQQDDNPVKAWCSQIREFIKGNTNVFPKIKTDGNHIIRLDRFEFDNAVLKEFTNPTWKTSDSKLLAWRNKTVTRYNKALHKKNSGNSDLAKGDFAVNNHYVVSHDKKNSIKTDATVLITGVSDATEYGVKGRYIDTDKCCGLFQPDHPSDRDEALARAVREGDAEYILKIKDSWCDLRAAYACTVNKSQGSTFNKVFIDLDDILLCQDSNQMSRMLYVAMSRARTQVIITGG